MTTLVETLAVRLTGDTSDYTQKMAAADSKWKSVASNMKTAGAKLSLGVTAPLTVMGFAALNAASDLEESANKVTVVFGDQATAIQEWSDTSATAFGLSKAQALEAAGTLGNLFSAMQIGGDTTADMSTSLVELAGDLASFNNIDPAEALEKLRAGIVGETEPLRTLGINLSAVAVEAKALSMGLVETTVDMNKLEAAQLKLVDAQRGAQEVIAKYGEGSLEAEMALNKVALAEDAISKLMDGKVEDLTAAQKAQASYALIMEQSALAQGDFGRTSDGLANSQRILKAELSDAAASLGVELLPVALELVNWLKSAMEWFKTLSPETRKWIVIIGGAAAALGPVVAGIGTLISVGGSLVGLITGGAGIVSSIGAVGAALAAAMGPIGWIILAVGALAAAWTTDFMGIRTKTTEVFEFLKASWPTWMDNMKQSWQNFTTDVKDAGQTMWSGLNSAWETGGNLLQEAGATMWSGLNSAWETGGNLLRSVADFHMDALKGVFEFQLDVIQNLFELFGWGDIGENIVDGIRDGIERGIQWVVDAARNVAQAAVDAAKRVLGISSPSTVAAAEIGEPMAEGMVAGWNRGLRGLTGELNAGISGLVGGVAPRAMATAATGAGPIHVHIEQTFNGTADSGMVRSASESGVLAALRQVGLR